MTVLLTAKPDVTVRDPQDRGVLDLAVGRLPGTMVDELRRRGARCNPNTDLLLAAAFNRPAEAFAALAKGASVDARDLSGRSALWWSAASHSVALGTRLLRQKADPAGGVEPPLLEAIRSQDLEMTRLLLAHGAAKRGRAGSDLALHLAVRKRNPALVRALLAAGADVNAAEPDGTTPLHAAINVRNLETVKLLLKHGADVNAKLWEATAPRTVLARACLTGGREMAHLLHAHGARLEGQDAQWIDRMPTLAEQPQLTGNARARLQVALELLIRFRKAEKP